MGRPEATCAAAEAGQREELEFHWGDAYDVAVTGGTWTARRRDGKGAPLTDPLPEGLRRKIAADYQAHPVPRDLP